MNTLTKIIRTLPAIFQVCIILLSINCGSASGEKTSTPQKSTQVDTGDFLDLLKSHATPKYDSTVPRYFVAMASNPEKPEESKSFFFLIQPFNNVRQIIVLDITDLELFTTSKEVLQEKIKLILHESPEDQSILFPNLSLKVNYGKPASELFDFQNPEWLLSMVKFHQKQIDVKLYQNEKNEYYEITTQDTILLHAGLRGVVKVWVKKDTLEILSMNIVVRQLADLPKSKRPFILTSIQSMPSSPDLVALRAKLQLIITKELKESMKSNINVINP